MSTQRTWMVPLHAVWRGWWRYTLGMKFALRLFLGALVLVLLLTLGLAASLPIDAWINRDQVMALTNAQTADSQGVRMHLVVPDGVGPFPVVVMIHEFWGLNEALVSKTQLLAQEGVLVVAPDTLRGTTTRYLPKALWHTISTPNARVVDDLDAVIRYLQARGDVDAQRIVVMGFCYGGGKALAYALARPEVPAGTAVFYGDLSADASALARLRGPVLGVFGETDDLISLAEVAAFEAALQRAGTSHQLAVYPGVGHAFVTSAAGIAQDPVQADAWGLFTSWLAEVVGEE